ncbi:hypothetical protein EQ718_23410 (plasmid) [Paracoccus versutus]|uniref:Uncharacterized protein n=1 Tax=Paracoccus versutus TaxID=34007 RepID=A0A099FJH6_PARVE|nr:MULTISPECIES: hypothetical protein [Paracoccus]WGR63148.1 hypothetical protein E3U26_20880 [Paracoccus ferrooxidans]SFX00881.1 hypothetical protein SAMN04244548_00071 [Paracoccus pantotrophus]KGJ10794.1 hypothetical protein IT40_10205 [Paracoccus versutus]MBT0780801.1 hypothetical protein [Paracoccus sp. pheM1]MCJ1899894.1 hypothetical protein [Paracoccus versutus]
MYLPPIIHDALIDSAETEGYVPGAIESVMRFGPHSRWCAGVIAACSTKRSQALATRCALLIPRKGKRTLKLAVHPSLPADVIKSMLNAI